MHLEPLDKEGEEEQTQSHLMRLDRTNKLMLSHLVKEEELTLNHLMRIEERHLLTMSHLMENGEEEDDHLEPFDEDGGEKKLT